MSELVDILFNVYRGHGIGWHSNIIELSMPARFYPTWLKRVEHALKQHNIAMPRVETENCMYGKRPIVCVKLIV